MALPAERGVPTRSSRIGRAVLGIAAGMAVGWLFAHPTWVFLRSPVFHKPAKSCACYGEALRRLDHSAAVFGPHLRLAFVFGLVVSSPVWLHQLLALRGRVRRRDDLAAVSLFVIGAALAYLSLRSRRPAAGSLVTVSGYLDQAVGRLVLLGLVMELPLLAVIALRARRGVRDAPE